MPLAPPVIYAELTAARATGPFPFAGLAFEQLAMGISIAVSSWALGQPQNVALQGIAAGAVGAGAIVPVSSKIIVPPTVPVMSAALSGAGLNGQLQLSLAMVVTQGISGAFTKYAQYVGPVAGVGVGQDVSKVISTNAPALETLLYASLGGTFGSAGLAMPNLASGLAKGIAGLVLLGTGTGTVAGVPGPAPASGTSTSVIV